MWIVLLLAYGVLLAAGTWFITSRSGEPESKAEFFAASALEFNHLIVEKDLRDAAASVTPASPAATNVAPAPPGGTTAAPVPPASTTVAPGPDAHKAPGSKETPPAASVPTDPKKAKFVGKYTSGTVGQRQLLRPRELTSMPSLGPSDTAMRMLVPVGVDDVRAGRINAGSWVCAGLATPLKVAAVICAPAIEAPCNAIVDVPVPPDAAPTLSFPSSKSIKPASADKKCS
jgi:hypothetical protein